MSFPYLCLSCNRLLYADQAGRRTIQCECGKDAFALRCNCTGQVDDIGKCVDCGERRG